MNDRSSAKTRRSWAIRQQRIVSAYAWTNPDRRDSQQEGLVREGVRFNGGRRANAPVACPTAKGASGVAPEAGSRRVSSEV